MFSGLHMLRRILAKEAPGYVFLAPWLIGFFLLAIGPILASLYFSFTRYDVVNPPRWVGLENFEYMLFYDRRFWKSLHVTFNFVIMSVPAKLIFALAVA